MMPADMKHAQLVPQGSLNRILQAAEEAWKRRDFQQTIDQLERASRLAPANCQVLLQLGRVYGFRYDFASAERCFEKAIRVAPKKTEMLSAAGYGAVDFINPQLAERYFRQAAEQPDVSARALARLAELYERLRRVPDAEALIDRALHKEPDSPSTLLIKARLNRTAGRLEDAERIVQGALKAEDKETRVRAFYELGMILDRLSRCDEAMNAFLEAKSLLRSDAAALSAQLQVFRNFWGEMQANISPEIFQRWFAASLEPRHRIAYLGGYPRSGTTLLEQVLDSHPEIVSVEETTLFNDEAYIPLSKNCPPDTSMLTFLESAQPGQLKQVRENYFRQSEKHIGSPIGNRLLIDKHPSLMVLIPSFLRVFPEIKLLIALRDPRDVCLSCFMQAHLPLDKGNVAYLTMEGTVEGYTRVMGLWRTLAPMLQGHYLEVRYEDMVEDLKPVAQRTLEFLGMPWDDRVLAFHEHAQAKKIRSPTYADVAKPIFRRAMGRWQKYAKYLEPHLEKLEPFVKAFGYS